MPRTPEQNRVEQRRWRASAQARGFSFITLRIPKPLRAALGMSAGAQRRSRNSVGAEWLAEGRLACALKRQQTPAKAMRIASPVRVLVREAEKRAPVPRPSRKFIHVMQTLWR